MVGDLNVFLSVKVMIFMENEDFLGFKFESEFVNYIVE